MVEYLSQFNIIFIVVAATLATGAYRSAAHLFTKNNISPGRPFGGCRGNYAGGHLFQLILPAIESGGGHQGQHALIGILAGGVFLDLVDKCFPNTNLAANLAEPVKNGRF